MKKKSILITNKECHGVLGHGVNPLTTTLMSNGKVTLNIIFRSIEKFSVKYKNEGINIKNLIEILDRITTYSFCIGIKRNMWKRLRKNTGVQYLKYPFRRYQSVNCPVWFKSTTVTHQCQHCRDICQKIEKPKESVPIQKNKQPKSKESKARITVKGVIPKNKLSIKDVQRVVVEPVECVDTVLQCVLPP